MRRFVAVLMVAAVSLGFAPQAIAAALTWTGTFTNTCRVATSLSYQNNGAYSYTTEQQNCSNVKVTMRWYDYNGGGLWVLTDPGYTSNSTQSLYKLTTEYPDYSRHYGKYTNTGSYGVRLNDCDYNCHS